jgi:hypothetical protein
MTAGVIKSTPATTSATNANAIADVAGPRAMLLGRFVPGVLVRQLPMAKRVSPFRLTLFGLVTAGILPAYWLVQRTGSVVSLQSQQMELATELLALHQPTDIDVVQAAAVNITGQPWMMRLMYLCISGAMISAAMTLLTHGWTTDAFRQLLFYALARNDIGSIACLLCVTAASLLALLMMNRHTVVLQQYTLAFNAQQGEALPLITPPGLVFGLKPLHLILAGVLAWCGLLWSVPVMLGWAAFEQMLYTTTQPFRAALAERLQQISGIEPAVDDAGSCTTPGCRAVIPSAGAFCPRCGCPNKSTERFSV